MSSSLPLYTKALVFLTLQTIFISFLCSKYDIDVPWRPTADVVLRNLRKTTAYRWISRKVVDIFGEYGGSRRETDKKKVTDKPPLSSIEGLTVFMRDQLALFDGKRSSNPVYLALLGKVFNVEKGRKHYAANGGYSFFAGRDATRAFVTGDFSETGLIDDVSELSESDLLSIEEWLGFYEREYELIGVLEGTYYDSRGKPTRRLKEVQSLIEHARIWKEKQLKENEVFPPCNSEWQKETGGRIWCTNKSGGVKRDWVGVPRKLHIAKDKSFRCACVKNFGAPLSEYENCPSTANSCKINSQR
ncbi:cytochrome b5-like heme/Steroid binding domain-containing protein [Ditylenchus destructor]|nr:cytochrome b5-like heme/Steroid binding domain-containing protein [Ditylenchus destructor]